MWDEPDRSVADIKMMVALICAPFVALFIYLNIVYQNYKIEHINSSDDTVIEEVFITNSYNIDSEMRRNSNEQSLDSIFKTTAELNAFIELEDRIIISSYKTSHNMFTNKDRVFFGKHRAPYQMIGKNRFYFIQSEFLDDTNYLCLSKKIKDEECIVVQYTKKLTD